MISHHCHTSSNSMTNPTRHLPNWHMKAAMRVQRPAACLILYRRQFSWTVLRLCPVRFFPLSDATRSFEVLERLLLRVLPCLATACSAFLTPVCLVVGISVAVFQILPRRLSDCRRLAKKPSSSSSSTLPSSPFLRLASWMS